MNSSHRHSAGTLNVVVKARKLLRVCLKETTSVWEPEIFKVEDSFREDGLDGLDNIVNELVVLFAADSRFANSKVEVVFEEFFILQPG